MLTPPLQLRLVSMLSDRAFEQGLDLAIAGIEADMAPGICARGRVPPRVVGKLSAVLPIRKYGARTRTIGNRPEQEDDGAPGLDRTADTRFRKHATVVVGGSAACANVLHSPGFRASQVSCRAQV